MNLTDIENMTHAQLKERHAELVAEAAKQPADALAARYVQARTDAKQRDEKLAEQGKTITLLQQSLDKAAAELESSDSELAKAQGQLAEQERVIAAHITAANDTLMAHAAELDQLRKGAIQPLKESLAATVKERDAALSLARSRRTALADVMTFAGQLQSKVAPLLAEEA